MSGRRTSPARLGVSEALVPRLIEIGWIVDNVVGPEVEVMLRRIRAGADPEGTLLRLVALGERRVSPIPELARLVPLAAGSRGLWESLLRHPNWLDNPPVEGDDPRLRVQAGMIEIALEDLDGRSDLDRATARLSQLADGAAEET
ncbi:MAG: hypothetical protein ACT4OP_06555, partial [Actinomycetota bacterium]